MPTVGCNVFLEIRHIACFSLNRQEWSIDLHIVDTRGFTSNPRITNEVHKKNEKQET
jgi:hypothetical protein